MRKVFILVIGLLSASFLFGQQEKLVYQMKALGKNIGTVTVKKSTEEEDTYYQTKSKLEVNLLIKKIRMEVVNNTHYHQGKLYKSTAQVTINGEAHTSSSISWDGHQYIILVDGEKQEAIRSDVGFSGSVLYFEEPSNIDQSLSETSGQYMSVIQVKEGEYKVTDPRNNRDMLHVYEKGKLTTIKIKHPLVTISFKLIDSDML